MPLSSLCSQIWRIINQCELQQDRLCAIQLRALLKSKTFSEQLIATEPFSGRSEWQAAAGSGRSFIPVISLAALSQIHAYVRSLLNERPAFTAMICPPHADGNLEHLRWLAWSGHPLAERLACLRWSKGERYSGRKAVRLLNFSINDTPLESWLPDWAQTFLEEDSVGLNCILDKGLISNFRTLWLRWDEMRLPPDAFCRLVASNGLLTCWNCLGYEFQYDQAVAQLRRYCTLTRHSA